MNKRTLLALTSTVLLAAACTPAPKENKIADPGTQVSGTVELWHFFTEREADAIQQVITDFQNSHPNIKVTVKPGQDDSKVTQAIGAGNGPDVGLSYSTDIVGKFCSSGAWVDLKPYIERDKVDLAELNATTRSYTEFDGKRCAMPFLADAYGMYYNKDLFAKAGLAGPPKTLDELTAYAKKLTVKNADGSLKTVGFLPLYDFYENAAAHLAPATGAKWLTEDGKSAVGSDPNWKALISWQKDLVDWYGYDNLTKFKASLGDEFSADNAFQKGQVAINIDAEYRLAFLKDQSPNLRYGVAPLPTTDPARYGGGYVTGNIVGISKNAKNPEAAWELIKYLTTNDTAVIKLAGLLKNVPTTTRAIADPSLNADPDFKAFIDIFNNPNSQTSPPSASGPAYQETFGQFLTSYQSGKVTDLDQGLATADQQINSVMSLGG
ncbi:multiple sugar transport system substrate-binding protein [Actinoplanes octamycinicus]|uniref:Multiple sugar transport system substrate-binding protein n=1 Tax=Actinoplanes octamycinicus TaxID=135948 RepID=A0A7W7M975_9ACTN|nr:ABC transporter substrate-binding protein [Actinoplanes octamycinicus]MBB4741526.1 multiple sugar transport system substrate-binding protein [Actinoplanes octamycinicus]GIE57076.1 sugar ABC transporter substrate-binding protein [Actinoplanes octamycinicus]